MVTEESHKIDNFRRISGTKIYRSSKPDTPLATLFLKQQNIKTVIDLTNDTIDGGNKCFDDIYPTFKLRMSSFGRADVPHLVSITGPKVSQRGLLDENKRYRVLVPLCSMRRLVAASPWYVRLLIILCSLIDHVFATKTALKAVAWTVGRPLGKGLLLWTMTTILTEHGADITSILQLLSLPEYMPAVLICGLGKDRTGLLSAIIGHICGNTKEDIIEDFTLSEKELPSNKKEFLLIDELGVNPIMKKAPPETLHDLYDFVDKRYGSMDSYLESIGFGQDLQEKLRRNIMAKY